MEIDKAGTGYPDSCELVSGSGSFDSTFLNYVLPSEKCLDIK
jgi:hypothetical protein